jgi:hypothetical protein
MVMAAKFRMVLTPVIAEEIARGKGAERNLEKKNRAGNMTAVFLFQFITSKNPR